MFGNPRPPKPPKYEPFLLLVLAVLIAGFLTVGYYGLLVLAERMQEGG